MIQKFNAFTVIPKYRRSQTAFDVHVDGVRAPVARARKDSSFGSLSRYTVHSEPQLEFEGFVTPFKATIPGSGEVGSVDHRVPILGKTQWIFAQKNMPELRGVPSGINSTVRHTFPISIVGDNSLLDAVFSFRLHFRAPESDGFELTRLAGARARFRVKVHDDRVSRLLILCSVVHFARYATADPVEYAVSLTSFD
ncbi:hypothetical protein [Streptomyces orinoci]|uniref:Uncharacterized protein n=1 Tax=Streptomyces orinoci TaxID=67339 RepID=A0ABV3K7H7_STRON|nr:hypothetical protein [Streptomyces orinoci]